MKAERIVELLHLGENVQVEFKADLRNVEAIGQVVCAFLNSSGGYIIIGADHEGRVGGVKADKEKLHDLEQHLHEGLSPKALVSVEAMELDGKRIVLIEVPQGRDLPYSFDNMIHLRADDQIRLATPAEIRDIVLSSQIEPERWERRLSLAQLDKDLDRNEVAAAVKDAVRAGRAFFNEQDDPVKALEGMSVSRYGRLTHGGDVLFAKNPAARLPQTRVRAFRYKTDKAGDEYGDIKSFEGPLHTLFEHAYAFIVQNTPTTARFIKGSPLRVDSPQYPEASVREALINALVHRDYASPSGGVSIHIYPTRMEITNAGSLPEGVTPESLAEGQISVLRNPDIAHVVYLRGLMEKAGRGSVLIIKECAEHGLPAPTWTSTKAGVTLTLYAPHDTPHVTPHDTPHVTPHVTPQVERLLKAMKDRDLARQEIMDLLGIKDRKNFMDGYIKPALELGLLAMTLPDKLTSVNQRYRLTEQGKALRAKTKK
ncbi:MAG TPA: putative DNA binding domain-containing protein [Flavobacteriales bacterium]|nr:putative DNA binding domain-containing protein [Flavobacteriales bacterium]